MQIQNSSSFFDYELALRKDLRFQHRLEALCKEISRLAELSRVNMKHKSDLNSAILALLEHTRFNIAPLLPYYFPRYPKNTPFSLRNFPYAYAMYNLTFGRDSFMCIKGSRQIIKSTCMATRDVLALQLFGGLRSMLVTPRPEQLKTIADKYKEISQAYRFYKTTPRFRQNLFYKEYPNDSILKMIYILTNADKARGNSMDWINIDEYQDFDAGLELELLEVLSQSDVPMVTKTGTSKTVDTALEAAYEVSSRSVWCIPCPACGHDNHLTLENNVLDMIQPKGVCCSKCGALLNVRDGFWDHGSPKMVGAARIGLHVPKIIVPEMTERPDKWYPIYRQSLSKDKKKFLEEVLGIATQEGAREITTRDLEAMCVLGDRAKLRKNARAGKYHYIVSGCDWGGSDYIPAHGTKESYTVHVMIGVRPDWGFDIIHMDQFSGMNYPEIAGIIAHDHKQLKGYALASDFGVGAAYNMELRKLIPQHRHIIFNYAGPTSAFIATPKNAHLYNQYALNKTDSITKLFTDMKSGRIQCYNWSEAGELLSQCTNLIRNPNPDTGTITYRRHGARPDDILHGINFAVQLAKIIIGETLFEDEAENAQLHENLAGEYLPDPTNMRPGEVYIG
jgi:hypothetical protein